MFDDFSDGCELWSVMLRCFGLRFVVLGLFVLGFGLFWMSFCCLLWFTWVWNVHAGLLWFLDSFDRFYYFDLYLVWSLWFWFVGLLWIVFSRFIDSWFGLTLNCCTCLADLGWLCFAWLELVVVDDGVLVFGLWSAFVNSFRLTCIYVSVFDWLEGYFAFICMGDDVAGFY